ncbi:putative Ig domain-containing protein [Rhodanobacter lindaniclasticus]
MSSPTAGPKFYGFMFALRRADPTFRMTGLLSATGTVGTAYSSTLTLAGDFTGPVTISGLPAWLSGTVSGNTVTISGTPTTADTYDFTPVATDSASQAATGSAQSIVVAAASADPVLVQQQVSLGSASGSTRCSRADLPSCVMQARSAVWGATPSPRSRRRRADRFRSRRHGAVAAPPTTARGDYSAVAARSSTVTSHARRSVGRTGTMACSLKPERTAYALAAGVLCLSQRMRRGASGAR